MIQKRVTEYVKRMFNNKLIDQKTKQYLVQNDPRPGRNNAYIHVVLTNLCSIFSIFKVFWSGHDLF